MRQHPNPDSDPDPDPDPDKDEDDLEELGTPSTRAPACQSVP
jgi:hypothetical protein